METNPVNWLEAAERLFNKAMGYGIVFLFITGIIWVCFRFEVLEKSMLSGYAYDGARLLCIASGALLLIGLITTLLRALGSIIAAPFRSFADRRSERLERKRLVQNVKMLRPEARAHLYVYIQQSDGRFQSPGENPIFNSLLNLGLVEKESLGSYVIVGTFSGELMRVNPLLLNRGVIESIGRQVEGDYPGFGVDPRPFLNKIATSMRLRGDSF